MDSDTKETHEGKGGSKSENHASQEEIVTDAPQKTAEDLISEAASDAERVGLAALPAWDEDALLVIAFQLFAGLRDIHLRNETFLASPTLAHIHVDLDAETGFEEFNIVAKTITAGGGAKSLHPEDVSAIGIALAQIALLSDYQDDLRQVRFALDGLCRSHAQLFILLEEILHPDASKRPTAQEICSRIADRLHARTMKCADGYSISEKASLRRTIAHELGISVRQVQIFGLVSPQRILLRLLMLSAKTTQAALDASDVLVNALRRAVRVDSHSALRKWILPEDGDPEYI